MKKITYIGKILYWTILAGLGIAAILIAVSIFNIPGGFKLYTVQSGSMEPNIHTGSLVVIQPAKEYRVNDVITFKVEHNVPTTHRLQKIENGTYTTKGDANNAPDSVAIKRDQIIGKVILSVPYIGYPMSFAKSKNGFLLLIVIPATLIIYSELINIKNEAVKLWKKKHA